MKWVHSISFIAALWLHPVYGQEPTATIEQQLEDITEMMEDAETSDDSWWQLAESLAKDPLNLNTADEDDLKALLVLSPLQISGFLQYRKLLGKLISIYELQAIPGWDLSTIEKLLPYITVRTTVPLKEDLLNRLRSGGHHIIARYSRQLVKPAGYQPPDSGKSHYTGDPSRMLLRYRYQHKNDLQYGITLSKDAGEPFLKYPNKYGFDFHSFHYFSRHKGLVKTVALGDYTINLGQGLIHWQSLAFGKGGSVMNVKRQAQVLRPYNSAGYLLFNRGMAVTLQKKNWEATLFASLRKLDANTNVNEAGEEIVTSIKTSGYRRTPSEIADKNSLSQLSYGGTLQYSNTRMKLGFNNIHFHYDKYIQREKRLYNTYAISGTAWSNYSVDYAYTFRNIHLFGETAIDRNGSIATLNSLVASLHTGTDFVLLYRDISKTYQAMYGNAFTVNTNPSNEKGAYAGITLSPRKAFQINAYIDIYRFPWLKYRVDAPSRGRDYFVQLHYKPDKLTEIYSRFRKRFNPVNDNSSEAALNEVVNLSHLSWRTQISHKINSNVSIRHRFELLWYQQEAGVKEKGFLAFFDLFYKPLGKPFSFNARLQYFDSNSYNSRLYAYENDVLYYYAVPVFYDKGSRYYINVQYKLSRHLQLWCKLSQTVYSHRSSVGSGLDKTEGNKRPEIRVLLSARL